MIHNKTELYNLLQTNSGLIKELGVSKLGVFGSFRRNEVLEESDVDLLVHFYPEMKNIDNMFHLHELIKNLTGRKVELITPAGLSKFIGPHILKEVEYVQI